MAEVLCLAIVSRGFVPAEHLVPERIATELGVSRPPAIAALRQPDREGLVTIGNNGRPYVVGPTPRYVADMHRFRMMLDQTIVSSVADKPLRCRRAAAPQASEKPPATRIHPFQRRRGSARIISFRGGQYQ